jgi:hypothetical protein
LLPFAAGVENPVKVGIVLFATVEAHHLASHTEVFIQLKAIWVKPS